MMILYANKWSRHRKRPVEEWDVNRARVAYEKRSMHSVIVSEKATPIAFIEFNGAYIGVGFLDHRLRDYMNYVFDEVTPGKLFLTRATHREYEGDTDRVKSGTSYYFKLDGSVNIKKEDFAWSEGHSSPTVTAFTKDTHVDVSNHWEAYPQFGEYDSLLRVDR